MPFSPRLSWAHSRGNAWTVIAALFLTGFAGALVTAMATLVMLGEFEAGRDYLTRACKMYDPAQHAHYRFEYGQDIGATALCYLTWAQWHLGETEQEAESEVRIEVIWVSGDGPAVGGLGGGLVERVLGEGTRVARNDVRHDHGPCLGVRYALHDDLAHETGRVENLLHFFRAHAVAERFDHLIAAADEEEKTVFVLFDDIARIDGEAP